MKCIRQVRPCALPLFLLAATVCSARSTALGADGANAQETSEISDSERTFFEERIRPVLVERCYECHSHAGESLSAEYALDSREGIRAGGTSGEAAIRPGDPEGSVLLQALRYEHEFLQMPPDEPLAEMTVDDFERWIAMGAPDPRGESPQELQRQANAESAKELWSLQPPIKPEVPQVEKTGWPRTDIDHFVLQRMEQNGLQPIADADPAKLVRRVYFDLIGLPPSPQAVEQFKASPTRDAFTAMVDSLLNSPRFGERWGRHWLDLARYAESSGMEFNFTYPHAWPYRDYVIDAFNQDKPYDEFITEQLAGDLLPSSTPEDRIENRLATGFLAVGPKRHNAGRRTFQMEMVDDQIKATTEAFLGLTVGCARCHDHKFDPIPTEDYYALAGIFLSTKTLYGTTQIKYSRHPSEKIPFGPNAQQRHAAYQAHQKKIQTAQKSLSEQQEKAKELEGKPKEEATAKIKALEEKVKRLEAETPEPPKYAMGAAEGKPADTQVAVGGDPGNRGETVARGFLSAVPVEDAPAIDKASSGRLELARWIASRENPLTARVFVNRVWHHLFGRGLVPSVNNFGTLGDRPSHPELLDHLAIRFVENDWSIKSLIRSLVLSRAYQLDTRTNVANFQKDPDNVFLWRMTPRRLEVEPLRDAILAVSGQLNLTPGQGSTVTALGQQLARAVSADKLNPPNHHRTVYLPVVRHYTAQMLQEFDFAASSLVVGDRAETTTSQQALFFLNSDFIQEQAEATARLLRELRPDDAAAQIHLAYERALSRPPSPAELTRVKGFLQQVTARLQEKYPQAQRRQTVALASFVQTLFGSAEFRYLIHSPQHDAATGQHEPGGLAAAETTSTGAD